MKPTVAVLGPVRHVLHECTASSVGVRLRGRVYPRDHAYHGLLPSCTSYKTTVIAGTNHPQNANLPGNKGLEAEWRQRGVAGLKGEAAGQLWVGQRLERL